MNSKLNQRRQELGLSTTEVSHRLGVSQSTIVRLEQSEAAQTITLASLQKAAQVLGCSFSYQLTPINKTKRKKSYRGLKRLRTSISKQTKSALSKSLRKDIESNSRKLSLNERIRQTCSLSDLAKELRCSRTR